jgi:undecaprenyl diphosphate synthase
MSQSKIAIDPLLEPAREKIFFDSKQLALLDLAHVPRHVAIIMDGNRRWARQRGLPPVMGYWEGAEILTDIVCAAAQLGVKTLTVYAFSTENWSRPNVEVEALMNIFEIYLKGKREQMIQEGICLDAIGDISKVPARVQEAFFQTKKETQECSKINLVLAMNYGGRNEILRAFLKIFEQNEHKKLSPQDLTEDLIARHLDTSAWGDPDLMIRTSGELRVSNFLLWQMSYAEIYITDVLWPDFCPAELLEAILVYQKRDRRIGGGFA